MIKIILIGKHSNRTPLSYPVYKSIAERRGIIYVDDVNVADIAIFGFVIDLQVNSKIISDALSRNPQLKIAILSEEPLWDTIWSPNYIQKNASIKCSEGVIQYTNLSHFTTNIYNFTHIPYFITTEDKYIVRYSNFLARNISYSRSQLMDMFSARSCFFSSIAEKRLDSELHKYKDGNLIGLSKIRTQIADAIPLSKKCVGKGWDSMAPRQSEVDWHLAKLSEFDNFSIVMSAIENTLHDSYITEKLFDAYATLSFPLYFANSTHQIHDLLKNNSALLLDSDNLDSAVNCILDFQLTWRARLDSFIEDSMHLKSLVSDFEKIKAERMRVVDEVVANFADLLN